VTAARPRGWLWQRAGYGRPVATTIRCGQWLTLAPFARGGTGKLYLWAIP